MDVIGNKLIKDNHSNAFSEQTSDSSKQRDDLEYRILRKALLIRQVEERLLTLFGQGKLFGTVHTCIGQEFSGAVITEFLEKGDAVFSNHRCHGHFLAFTDDTKGLIAEIMGKKTGVCSGIGGSQHLYKDGFYSNGVQGGIVPIATGLAFARKLRGTQKIAVVFIGDGTLGEGTVYECFNLVAKWKLPLLIVLENNRYAQSTCQEETLAGDICKRAEAFGIRYAKGDTWDWKALYGIAHNLVNMVRQTTEPAFLQIDTYRLRAHSKGDDNRDPKEIDIFQERDNLNIMLRERQPIAVHLLEEVTQTVDEAVESAERAAFLFCNDLPQSNPSQENLIWENTRVRKCRIVKALNETFKELMQAYPKMFFIGEDVLSPYGGAFKISDGLSDLFPDRVRNTPISEAAITGLGCGLAIEGYRPFIEIMFGDFMTLTFDQIINHASKFRYMYHNQVSVPLVIRTPMGGGRGYGPTHSQTLDRHFMGIPGLTLLAINNLIDPKSIYESVIQHAESVTLVIENKLLYSQYLRDSAPEGFELFVSKGSAPVAWLKPMGYRVDLTLIGYGGLSEIMVKVAERLFDECDIVAQIICPTQIYPFSIKPFIDCIETSNGIVIIEEGQGFAAFGAEVIAQLVEHDALLLKKVKRIFAAPFPIPSAAPLENEVLPNVDNILSAIVEDQPIVDIEQHIHSVT